MATIKEENIGKAGVEGVSQECGGCEKVLTEGTISPRTGEAHEGIEDDEEF